MAHKEEEVKSHFVLPPTVTGPVELGRILRELQEIDELSLQASLREHPKKEQEIPKPSKMLDHTLEANKLHAGNANHRKHAINALALIKEKAPSVHMSFATDPSGVFNERLVEWLRKEIHPYALLLIGLQPNIGAGCILRTTNKYFDLSLKEEFAGKRDLLIEQIEKSAQKAEAKQPAEAAA